MHPITSPPLHPHIGEPPSRSGVEQGPPPVKQAQAGDVAALIGVYCHIYVLMGSAAKAGAGRGSGRVVACHGDGPMGPAQPTPHSPPPALAHQPAEPARQPQLVGGRPAGAQHIKSTRRQLFIHELWQSVFRTSGWAVRQRGPWRPSSARGSPPSGTATRARPEPPASPRPRSLPWSLPW